MAFSNRPSTWDQIKDKIDLARTATALMGPAVKRAGRSLLWRCPWHDDHDPSLHVDPAKGRWKCWPCDLGGDAMELVRRLNPGWSFRECVEWLAGQAGVVPTPFRPASGGSPTRPTASAAKPAQAGLLKSRSCHPHAFPSDSLRAFPTLAKGGLGGVVPAQPTTACAGLPLADALSLVTEAAFRLWEPEGAGALGNLRGRGLTDEAIRSARLGWTPGVGIPIEGGIRYWRIAGVVIPWLDGDRLALVKIRRLGDFKGAKYIEAYRDRPGIYPSPAVIKPGKPLILTEGEFDALLLGQALGDLAAVVTLGSASAAPEAGILGRMLTATPWFIATDSDCAGNKAASGWPGRAIRVKPPVGKDWTDAAQYGVELGHDGVNLRRWWIDRLGGTEAPELFTWEEQSPWRWDDAAGDPDAMTERLAIQEFG